MSSPHFWSQRPSWYPSCSQDSCGAARRGASSSSSHWSPPAFAVLDIAEVIHQLDEDRTGLALLAGVIATAHAAAAALAVQQATTRPVTAHQSAQE